MSVKLPGVIVGRAGVGLRDGNNDWAANAEVARMGLAGEQATERVLNDLASRPGGFTVVHDVTIPGSTANIDHLVISGHRIVLVDSKKWKPGIYWNLGSRMMRGGRRFTAKNKYGKTVYPGEKQTMVMAADRLSSALRKQSPGCGQFTVESVIVVWSSSQREQFRSLYARMPGARLVAGADLSRRTPRILRSASADTALVSAVLRATGRSFN